MPNKEKDAAGQAAIEDDALERLFRSRYSEGSAWCMDPHKEAREDFRLYGNHQWDDKDLDWGRKTQYPCLTLNQIFSLINAPSSSEIVNRYEPKYLPRSPEDQDLADKTTQVARYIRQQAGAEFVDSGAFRDSLICGMGFADWWFDETKGSEGQLQTKRIPIEEVIWDPAARKQNLEDARWIVHGVWMDLDEYRVLFPDAPTPESGSPAGSETIEAGMFMWGRSSSHVTTPIGYQEGANKGFYLPGKRTVLVFEMQDWITEAEYKVVDEMTGETITLDQDQFEEWRKIRGGDLSADGVPLFYRRMRRVYRRSIFGGMHLIKQEEIPADRFTIQALTCFEDQTEEGMRWFGLVRPLRDPQKIANRGFSQIIHILATNPKGVMLHEGDVFANPREAEIQWARPSGRIEVTNGALQDNRIQIIKGQYPDDFERITSFCLNAVPRIAGIDPTFMGSSAGSGGDLRRVSGTALSQVLQQGQMMLSIPFDGLRKFRMDQGQLLLDLMRVFMPEEQMIRVLGEVSGPTPEFVQFIRAELDDVTFDLVVGEVPISPTAQRETWETLTESGALKALLDQQLLDGEDISELAADWPQDVRRRVRERAIQKRQMMEAMAGQGMPPEDGPPPAGPGLPPGPVQ